VVFSGEGAALGQLIGVASAWADKSPVIAIEIGALPGSSDSPVFDRERVCLGEAFDPVTRWSARATDWKSIPGLVRRAVVESVSARCGPTLVTIPPELIEREGELTDEDFAELTAPTRTPVSAAPPEGDPALVRAACELLARSKRPLILAGGGVVKSGAAQVVNELAKKLHAPIASTMGGTGAASPDNPCYLGPASYLAGETFHHAVKKADVVLALGCCFSGLDGLGLPPVWSSSIKFIQVNVDYEDISLNPPAEVAIVADADAVARSMLELAESTPPPEDRVRWLSTLRRMQEERTERIRRDAERGAEFIHPAAVAMAIHEELGDTEVMVVLDGGNTCLWAGMLVPPPEPRRGFFPFGMGTLGLGIPVAIGVRAAAPDRPVLLVTGDGAFLYHVQELETVKRLGVPLVTVIFNDSAWNMIRAGQAMTGEVYGTDLPGQDYVKVAESYGIKGSRVTRIEDFKPALREAVDSGEPALIDVIVDPDVLPDAIISFARVEFDGATMPPGKLIEALKKGSFKFDACGRDLIRYIIRTM